MRVLFINPNSSRICTEVIKKEAIKYNEEGIEIDVIDFPEAPSGIVTSFDEINAGVSVVKTILEKEDDYDVAVSGCFADPGLRAARELAKIPVVGLYESSAIFAKMKGLRYSIVASGNHLDISPWHTSIRAIGDRENVASIKYINSTVEDAANAADEVIIEAIERCQREDGADVVILGCASFIGRGKTLTEKCGLPVLDGMEETIRLAEASVKYRK